jgi:hypothetical protein
MKPFYCGFKALKCGSFPASSGVFLLRTDQDPDGVFYEFLQKNLTVPGV